MRSLYFGTLQLEFWREKLKLILIYFLNCPDSEFGSGLIRGFRFRGVSLFHNYRKDNLMDSRTVLVLL